MAKLIRKRDDCIYIGNWYVGWHTWKFELSYRECGYEDGNARLYISLLGWMSVFILPWKSKRFPNGDCDEPIWGISIHANALWIYRGGDGNFGSYENKRRSIISWDFPFTYTIPACRWDVECLIKDPDGTVWPGYYMMPMRFMECKDNKNYVPIHKVGPVDINGKLYVLNTHHYDYTDKYDGEVVPCTYWVEEMEWRPKWLGWTSLFKRVHKSIAIEFSGEVGRDKGSWKGGCIGCGYEMLPGETADECIRRMERERSL